MPRIVVSVGSDAELLATIPTILGFHPADSLVVVPLGGGPTARVDLLPTDVLAAAFVPTVPQWSRVVVVLYGDPAVTQPLAADVPKFLPGVQVIKVICRGNEPEASARPAEIAAWAPPASSRETLGVETLDETDPGVCERIAVEAYLTGDGVRAWLWLDRARDLRGCLTPQGTDLEQRLYGAADPRTYDRSRWS